MKNKRFEKGEDEIRKAVREGYSKIVLNETSCCSPKEEPCCSPIGQDSLEEIGKRIGYTDEELRVVPEGANLGLGCGNPVALASLRKGETVIDLGSGAGFDCFLAAQKVGIKGKVIGVDMTPQMIDKARENAKKGHHKNVEFRLGEIENLPVADNVADIVISNCVINLSPNKRRVFQEAFRVLKPGGRLMVSDIVLLKKLPDSINNSIEAYIGCLSGAMLQNDYLEAIQEAGFKGIKIMDETPFPIECVINNPTLDAITRNMGISTDKIKDLASSVLSIRVCGVKPKMAQ